MMSIACVLEQMAITVLRNYLQNILFIGWFYKLALLDFEIIFEDKLKVVE